MIARTIFGIILGSIGESFTNERQWYGLLLSLVIALVFAIDSASYGLFYFLVAVVEYAVGYKLSIWFRLIKEKYGW